MFRTLGLPELLVIFAVILLLFGVGRVTKVGEELGSAISAFRRGLKQDDDPTATGEKNKSEV